MTKPHDDSPAVDALIDALDYPLVPVLKDLRKLILKCHPQVTEGVKWNSPSFYRDGWFATASARPNKPILLVLHQGAKTKSASKIRDAVPDPDALLTWASPDRATVPIDSAADLKAKAPALRRIIEHWATHHA